LYQHLFSLAGSDQVNISRFTDQALSISLSNLNQSAIVVVYALILLPGLVFACYSVMRSIAIASKEWLKQM